MGPILELRKVAPDHLPDSGAGDPQVLRITPPVNPAGSGLQATEPKPWESFLVRMTLSWLVFVVPFFVLADIFKLAQQVLWLRAGALLALVAILALSAWWSARPLLALSQIVAAIESGDLTLRAVPGGSAETRRLAHAVNQLLDDLAIELPRIRNQASKSAGRLAVSAERIGAVTTCLLYTSDAADE